MPRSVTRWPAASTANGCAASCLIWKNASPLRSVTVRRPRNERTRITVFVLSSTDEPSARATTSMPADSCRKGLFLQALKTQ